MCLADLRVTNPKVEWIRVSGDTNRRQAPLISGQAEALPYASPATSTYGGAEVFRFEVTGNPRHQFPWFLALFCKCTTL